MSLLKKMRFTTVIILFFSLSSFANNSVNTELMADFVVIEKFRRNLSLYKNNKLIKVYNISLGGSPFGHKSKEGDSRTPEGRYKINYKKSDSRFHLALQISYPNKSDRATALKAGNSPGGSIMIHGLGPEYDWVGRLHALVDWTDGCIAVTNEEIEEIFKLVPQGTEIWILQ